MPPSIVALSPSFEATPWQLDWAPSLRRARKRTSVPLRWRVSSPDSKPGWAPTVSRAIAASPDYLAVHGTPQQPNDLLKHNCLLLSGFARLAQWPMWERNKRILLPVKGNVRCDSADVLLDMALTGKGIARFSDFLAERAVAEGRLVPLLTDCHDADPSHLSALVLPGRHNIPHVRVML